MPAPNTMARILAQVVKRPDGCHDWTGYRRKDGRGQVSFAGRLHYVNRLIYEQQVGPLRQGSPLRTVCGNGACVNPDHMQPVSAAAAVEGILRRLRTTDLGCWVLPGKRPYTNGYVMVKVLGVRHVLHRLVYEHFCGPIPAGMVLHHRCENRVCCCPKHLMPLAPKQHRQVHNNVTHCPAGHEYDLLNTRLSANGSRQCRACQRGGAARRFNSLSDEERRAYYDRQNERRKRARAASRP